MTDGSSIICLHGLHRTAADWEPVRDALSSVGQVIAPQLPSRPQPALEILDTIVTADPIVIGHSMGGVLLMRLLSRQPRPLQAVVLTGCFFPPARNGRTTAATIRDYGAHRIAFARAARRESAPSLGRASITPLASLVRQAIQPRDDETALSRSTPSVLIIHARDDHHVPVDFAIAAARRHPNWTLELLEHGGHHAHTRTPAPWSSHVVPWLTARLKAPPS
jgi:pimeloyl-ACP methyl ester carboxylesterase